MSTHKNQPISPHLQVYKLPLTAIMSISHRITGVGLSVGTVLLVLTLVAVASGEEAYTAFHGHLSAWYGQIILFLFTFALYFHFCHGIRHLFWDAGAGFNKEDMDKFSKLTLTSAAVLTVLTWFVVLVSG
ncbi:MAG: succinate dehydrogenase, cytochrome b556 subunit [Gammaproteobacteria bacterium]|nr:succinate dehydrogenase, cytochrome b556 subunit [Gammaproteobacteria bacterium]